MELMLGGLTQGEQKRLMKLITMNVHWCGATQRMVTKKTQWSSRLQWLWYYWGETAGSIIQICTSQFVDGYECIGNGGCFVTTHRHSPSP
mmetsp:Transcript_133510/g.231555  ORF Transcript_133510/g.231555 Transcript_133510/m.231555 type:complete len:90 (+) Transcript_133510:1-270(+)